MASSPGRRRYRAFLLLVAAVALVVWFFAPAEDNPPSSSGDPATSSDARSSSPSSSPTHELTQTNTPSTEPTAVPSPSASEGTDPASGLPLVRLADLPPEAARTVELIDDGGPFAETDHDGGTFGNREELLPDEPYGYYREYTVPTPGLESRGARRIVAGQGGELYWTADHYSSFSRIRR